VGEALIHRPAQWSVDDAHDGQQPVLDRSTSFVGTRHGHRLGLLSFGALQLHTVQDSTNP
jgi:hypothetical protein